jgi:hypothetical protein
LGVALPIIQPCALSLDDLEPVDGGRRCDACATVVADLASSTGPVECGYIHKDDVAPEDQFAFAQALLWREWSRQARAGAFLDVDAGEPALQEPLRAVRAPGTKLEEAWPTLSFAGSVTLAALLGVSLRALREEVIVAVEVDGPVEPALAELLDGPFLHTPIWETLAPLREALPALQGAAPLPFARVAEAIGGVKIVARPSAVPEPAEMVLMGRMPMEDRTTTTAGPPPPVEDKPGLLTRMWRKLSG